MKGRTNFILFPKKIKLIFLLVFIHQTLSANILDIERDSINDSGIVHIPLNLNSKIESDPLALESLMNVIQNIEILANYFRTKGLLEFLDVEKVSVNSDIFECEHFQIRIKFEGKKLIYKDALFHEQILLIVNIYTTKSKVMVDFQVCGDLYNSTGVKKLYGLCEYSPQLYGFRGKNCSLFAIDFEKYLLNKLSN